MKIVLRYAFLTWGMQLCTKLCVAAQTRRRTPSLSVRSLKRKDQIRTTCCCGCAFWCLFIILLLNMTLLLTPVHHCTLTEDISFVCSTSVSSLRQQSATTCGPNQSNLVWDIKSQCPECIYTCTYLWLNRLEWTLLPGSGHVFRGVKLFPTNWSNLIIFTCMVEGEDESLPCCWSGDSNSLAQRDTGGPSTCWVLSAPGNTWLPLIHLRSSYR